MTIEAVKRLVDEAQPYRSAALHLDRFRLLTADELMSRPAAPYVVKRTIPANSIGAFAGPSGSGKTFLLHDMLRSVSEGSDWFSLRTNLTPVLYIGLEGESGIANRAKAQRIRYGRDFPGMRYMTTPLDIRSSVDREALVASIRSAGWDEGVVCFDTLNRAAPGMDENASQDMGHVIDALKELQRDLGGVVIVVHHTGKDASRGLRGHSSLIAALDFAIEVSRDGDRREWKLAKAKDAEDGETHAFKLEVVELGVDEDGDPITSCTVRPDLQPVETLQRVRLPQGGNQKVIYDALTPLFKASKDFGKAGAPAHRPCLSLEDAVNNTRGRLTCEPARQTNRARQAFTGLIASGILCSNEGWVWLK